ncbi:hypothetical protein [Micromonospora tulbaghiae]
MLVALLLSVRLDPGILNRLGSLPLILAPISFLQQMGFAAAIGIVLSAFVMSVFFVPAAGGADRGTRRGGQGTATGGG